jgi:predicted Zn-dependent protease
MNKKIFKNTGIAILLILMIAWLLSCAVNPVTGKREFMLLTEGDEIQLGKNTDGQIVQMYGIFEDQKIGKYINGLGQPMAKLSHRANLNWEFKVLDSPVINAFAVPGGFIYVTRGILAYLNSEAELAGVLGHEIGHVTARHSAKQYSKSTVAQLGLAVGSELSETVRNYAGIAQFGVGMLFLKFSRDNERQADALGVEYSTKSGFDSDHMANFFGTLERLHPSSGGSLPDWFSTHPNPPDRIKAIQRDAQKWKTQLAKSNYKDNKNGYLQKLNGMIYGPDPRQGYVEANVFYHPQMKFQFPVPASWQVNNTPSQVQMFTEKQDAVILFSLGKGASPKAAADEFVAGTKAVVKSSNQIRVSGLIAQQVISDVPGEQAESSTPVISTFVQMGSNIFIFHGFTSQALFNTYLPVFKNTMNKFKKLTDQRKINVKPAKLVIKKTTKRQTLRQALSSYRVSSDKFDELAVLNGRQLNDTIPANTLVKIVVK